MLGSSSYRTKEKDDYLFSPLMHGSSSCCSQEQDDYLFCLVTGVRSKMITCFVWYWSQEQDDYLFCLVLESGAR